MPTVDMNIRRGKVSDAQGVVDVLNSVIQEGGLTSIYPALTLEREEAYIEALGPRGALYVAEISDEILGFQTIEPFAPYTRAMDHVGVVGTHIYRNLRRRGVGRQLFERSLEFAREQGYEKLVAYIRASNSGGQAFYREMGFVPKMMIERQVKIDGRYDDQVWMEMFIPEAVPEQEAVTPAVEREPTPAPEPAALAPTPEPAAPAPTPQPAPEKAAPQVAVDPAVGAVTVRRAKRRDVQTLAAIMKGTMRWRTPPSEEEVLEMLFDKGYWLAMSRKGGGLTGWRAENLVMCIDDFYVYPPQYYPQVGGPLLETIETEAKALSCEVAIAFITEGIAPQAISFFESQGYERQELEEMYSVWREVAHEFLADGTFMMVKKLRERRVMRPL